MTSDDGERPLTARSVVAALLLGTEPAWLPTPTLLRCAALFGIADDATRTALSRMAQLLPQSWPGARLRQCCESFDRAYRVALAGWLGAVR